MQRWNLYEIATPEGSRSPVVLHTQDGESRTVLVALDPGQELGQHQVTEAALLLVVAGAARVETAGEAFDAAAGELFHFEPGERRSVSSEGGARLLLILAPWPGVRHYRGGDTRAGASAS